jgi:hypothetical protein
LSVHFIEKNDLKPGQLIEVEARDAAESVRLRCKGGKAVTIRARAASKLLVEAEHPGKVSKTALRDRDS